MHTHFCNWYGQCKQEELGLQLCELWDSKFKSIFERRPFRHGQSEASLQVWVQRTIPDFGTNRHHRREGRCNEGTPTGSISDLAVYTYDKRGMFWNTGTFAGMSHYCQKREWEMGVAAYLNYNTQGNRIIFLAAAITNTWSSKHAALHTDSGKDTGRHIRRDATQQKKKNCNVGCPATEAL